MKFVRWAFIFGFSFFLSFVLIMTFSQQPFHQKVAARIIGLSPPAIAIYWYVGAAFIVGLGIGLMVAAYYFFVFSSQIRRQNKTIRELEEQIQIEQTHEPATQLDEVVEDESKTPA
ncbi:MAG: hypothetical protein JW795_17240 [Chitinivibrionales bacterium]|nr:hypothetical protein [Chitinivibrionales bacterium]